MRNRLLPLVTVAGAALTFYANDKEFQLFHGLKRLTSLSICCTHIAVSIYLLMKIYIYDLMLMRNKFVIIFSVYMVIN